MRYVGQRKRRTATTDTQAGTIARTGLGGTTATMMVSGTGAGIGGTTRKTKVARSDRGVMIPLF